MKLFLVQIECIGLQKINAKKSETDPVRLTRLSIGRTISVLSQQKEDNMTQTILARFSKQTINSVIQKRFFKIATSMLKRFEVIRDGTCYVLHRLASLAKLRKLDNYVAGLLDSKTDPLVTKNLIWLDSYLELETANNFKRFEDVVRPLTQKEKRTAWTANNARRRDLTYKHTQTSLKGV